jgi:hypothetical protein
MDNPKPALLHIEDFNRRFDELLPQHHTMEAAYAAVEAEVLELYHHRKYTDFISFKQARYRWLRHRRKVRKAA